MPYKIVYSHFDGIFAVPNTVADKYLKICSPTALKVLLLLLRYPHRIEEIDFISGQLGLSTADTVDALNYWVKNGILQMSGQDPQPAEQLTISTASSAIQTESAIGLQEPAPTSASREKTQKIMTISSKPRISPREMERLAKQDDHIAVLLEEMQMTMGRPLSAMENETLISLYTYAGVPIDYILLAGGYCAGMGKMSIRYLEKTILDWMDQGIDSYEKAEMHIKRLGESSGRENMIKAAFGIYDRALSAQEKKFIQSWFGELNYDLPMIKLAYERTINNIGKLKFSYINSILSNWHAKGILTPKQVQEEERSSSRTVGEQDKMPDELEELERFIAYGGQKK